MAMRLTNQMMPEQMIKAIKAESKRTGLSISEIVRRAVDKYLEARKCNSKS